MMVSWSDFKKIDDNKFIVLTNYFEQYAWGIAGVSLESKIYFPKDGWDTRLEAQEFIERNGLRKRTIKGKDSPWGEVGRKVFEVYAIKKKDIEKKKYYGATTLYILVPDEEKVKNLKPVIEYDEIYKDCHLLVVFNHMGFRCGYIGLNDLETSEDELDEILQFHYGITFDRTTEDILKEKTAMITKYVKPDYKRYVGFDAGHFTDKNDIITLAKHAGLSEAEIEYGKSIFPSDKKATVKSLNFMVNNLKQGAKNLEEHKNKK